MALSIKARALLKTQFEAIAATVRTHISEGPMAQASPLYDLFVRIAKAGENPLDTEYTEQAEIAIVSSVMNEEAGDGTLIKHVQDAVYAAQEAHKAPGKCATFGAWLKSCCCSCGATVAKVIGPIAQDVVIGFIDSKLDKLGVDDGIKTALKGANKMAVTAVFDGVIDGIDRYTAEHQELMKQNVYLMQALAIAEQAALEIGDDYTIRLGSNPISVAATTLKVIGEWQAATKKEEDMPTAAGVAAGDTMVGIGAGGASAPDIHLLNTHDLDTTDTEAEYNAEILVLQHVADILLSANGKAIVASLGAEATTAQKIQAVLAHNNAQLTQAADDAVKISVSHHAHKTITPHMTKSVVAGLKAVASDVMGDEVLRHMQAMPDVQSSLEAVKATAVQTLTHRMIDQEGLFTRRTDGVTAEHLMTAHLSTTEALHLQAGAGIGAGGTTTSDVDMTLVGDGATAVDVH